MKRLKKCLSLILAIAVCMSTFFASTTSLEVMAVVLCQEKVPVK